MLKPVDPGPQAERPIGELVHELIEEGKQLFGVDDAVIARAVAELREQAKQRAR